MKTARINKLKATKNTGSNGLKRSNSMKKNITRMKHNAVQIRESKSITTRKREIELEADVYSDEEEEVEITFDEWTNLWKQYFAKQKGYECIPLNKIIQHHRTLMRKSKPFALIF